MMTQNAAGERVVIIVTFSEIMVLRYSCVRGQAEAELGRVSLLCTNFANYGGFILILGGEY